MVASTVTSPQDKKKAEADRQKELNDLFAIAIKQPKVPPGKDTLLCAQLAGKLLTASFHSQCCLLLLLLDTNMRVWPSNPVAQERHQAICFAATKLVTHIHICWAEIALCKCTSPVSEEDTIYECMTDGLTD